MTGSRWLVAIVTALGLAGVMAYFTGFFHENAQRPPTPPLQVEGERLVISPTLLDAYEPVPGTVSATDETVVGSRILATVTRVHVRAGDRVAQGDLLVEFDDSAQRSVLAQRQQAEASVAAAVEEAATARDRAIRLYESGNLSRADYDQALTRFRVLSAELERARRAVAEAEAQLGYTRIVAPMSGTVVDRLIEPGDTAVPGQPLLRLFDPGRLRVEAPLRESLIGRVSQGQQIPAVVSALDIRVSAVVEEIVPTADPGSRTFRIKALLPQQADLYPGMFARLEIPLGARPHLLVPQAAVIRAGQLSFLYVDGSHGPARRSVRTGPGPEGRIEVISGLEPGETVIVPGQLTQSTL